MLAFWRRPAAVVVLVLCVSSTPWTRSPDVVVNAQPQRERAIKAAFVSRPLAFERNQGLVDDDVQFLARAAGYHVFLTRDEMVVSATVARSQTADVVRMRFDGADAGAPFVGDARLPGRTHYLIGNDPANWRTEVPTYSSVRRTGVYPGVDVVYYGHGERLQFDFELAPRARVDLIRIRYDGAVVSSVTPGGDLLLKTTHGELRQHAPEIYQHVNGRRVAISGRYRQLAPDLVGFDLDAYDSGQRLVIDPVLDYATYLGTTAVSYANGIVVTDDGHAYVTGYAQAATFPSKGGLPTGFRGGASDVFITKFATDGQTIVFSTFLGGSVGGPAGAPNVVGSETGYGIALDPAGNVYVCGITYSSDFPIVNAFQPSPPVHPTFGRQGDGFLTKLTPQANGIVFSTYLGGTWEDVAYDVAADAAGNAYVAGSTGSADFPTFNATQPAKASLDNQQSGFVARFAPTGAAIYSTYWGSTSADTANAIAADADGNAYVGGRTLSSSFFLLNPFQSAVRNTDGYVTIFGPAGTPTYSTRFGGNGGDVITDLAIGPLGNIYITGTTDNGTNFPLSNAVQPNHAGGVYDLFVAKLTVAGDALVYSTFLGGTDNDFSAPNIAVDGQDRAVFSAHTRSSNFPLVNALQTTRSTTFNTVAPVVAKFEADGSALIYSTYVGGLMLGFGAGAEGVAVDASGGVYVTGWTDGGLLTTPDAFQSTYPGARSGYVLKIQDVTGPCVYGMLPGSTTIGSGGGPGSVFVTTTGSNCPWTATSSAPWVLLTGLTSGTGSGTVPFSVEFNNGVARVATITAAGISVTVKQEGVTQPGCSFVPAPTTASYSHAGGSGAFNVTASSGSCAWYAASNSHWITVTSNPNVTGNGSVSYTVAPNPAGNARSGTIVVGTSGSTTNFTVTQQGTQFIVNGSFSSGMTGWLTFATPDPSYMVASIVGGVFTYYRVPPPPGTSSQAVVFQETGVGLPAGAPLRALFDIGNSSSVRKRISVLILDGNFTDLSVCTFWLQPGAPLRTYEMRTHTTKVWANAAIYFYAATPGSDGGAYQLDNVSLRYAPDEADDQSTCIDPTAPEPTDDPDSPNLLANGDFGTGTLPPWGLFGQIVQQIAGGVFEFYRPAGTPAGVILQGTGQPMAANTIMTATFRLGNSSGVRKRVTVLLHEGNFSDLSACTFWLEPGQPLADYALRTFATQPWTNATLSIYPATIGIDQWIRLDDVVLRRTPSAAITGTECLEPGG